jgi:GNAT superfamily N-acetyltransferase
VLFGGDEGVEMSLSICTAADDDVLLLAQMNQRLIEDEGSRNPMSLPELEERMRGWLQGGWHVDLVLASQAITGQPPGAGRLIVGYAVYQLREDEYDRSRPVIYLRQFFIDRPYRNNGLGTLALNALVRSRFPARCTVVVDVLAGNPRGLRFWERVGFCPSMTTLKLDRE